MDVIYDIVSVFKIMKNCFISGKYNPRVVLETDNLLESDTRTISQMNKSHIFVWRASVDGCIAWIGSKNGKSTSRFTNSFVEVLKRNASSNDLLQLHQMVERYVNDEGINEKGQATEGIIIGFEKNLYFLPGYPEIENDELNKELKANIKLLVDEIKDGIL